MRMVLEGQQEAGAWNQMLLLRWKVTAMATLTETQNKKRRWPPFHLLLSSSHCLLLLLQILTESPQSIIQSINRICLESSCQHHKGAFKRVALEVKGNSLILCTCAHMRTYHQREFCATDSVLQLCRLEMFLYWASLGLPTALGYGRSFG